MNFSEAEYEEIRRYGAEALELLKELVQIPAPSWHEERRAEFCRDWLLKQGFSQVTVDEARNVLVTFPGEGEELVVCAAHTDTVFPDMEPLPMEIRDGRLYCPGAGDDTANVAVMLVCMKYLAEKQLVPRGCSLLFAANSGEEGLGNLRGSREIVRRFGDRIREFISLDLWSGQVIDRSVGSVRYRISIDTKGGHSYMNFGRKSAIQQMAALICSLYGVQVPRGGQTTYNVGTVSGGTSVNTIAQHAEMLYEIRSDRAENLEIMKGQLDRIMEYYRNEGYQLNIETVGERPCMGDVDMIRQKALADRAAAALERHFGKKPALTAGSTDCNIPLSLGIPAVTFGSVTGFGAHTREEYIDVDSLTPGVAAVLEVLLYYFCKTKE